MTRVKVDTYPGVAFYREAKCEKHFHCGIYVMVGDDRKHHIDLHDVTSLDDDEYCSECGQIGCAW
jgi:hypothetical protein